MLFAAFQVYLNYGSCTDHGMSHEARNVTNSSFRNFSSQIMQCAFFRLYILHCRQLLDCFSNLKTSDFLLFYPSKVGLYKLNTMWRELFLICACNITPSLTLTMSDMTVFSVRALDNDGKVTNSRDCLGIRNKDRTLLCRYIDYSLHS